jgi:hypothetical protein
MNSRSWCGMFDLQIHSEVGWPCSFVLSVVCIMFQLYSFELEWVDWLWTELMWKKLVAAIFVYYPRNSLHFEKLWNNWVRRSGFHIESKQWCAGHEAGSLTTGLYLPLHVTLPTRIYRCTGRGTEAASCQLNIGGVKRPQLESGHCPIFSDELKNTCGYTLPLPPYVTYVCCGAWLNTLTREWYGSYFIKVENEGLVLHKRCSNHPNIPLKDHGRKGNSCLAWN